MSQATSYILREYLYEDDPDARYEVSIAETSSSLVEEDFEIIFGVHLKDFNSQEHNQGEVGALFDYILGSDELWSNIDTWCDKSERLKGR